MTFHFLWSIVSNQTDDFYHLAHHTHTFGGGGTCMLHTTPTGFNSFLLNLVLLAGSCSAGQYKFPVVRHSLAHDLIQVQL